MLKCSTLAVASHHRLKSWYKYIISYSLMITTQERWRWTYTLEHKRTWINRPTLPVFYKNKSALAVYLGCQCDTARIFCWAPCCGRFCCLAPAPAIDRYILPARHLAASQPAAHAAERWDRQTDVRPFQIPCCAQAYYAGSVSKADQL